MEERDRKDFEVAISVLEVASEIYELFKMFPTLANHFEKFIYFENPHVKG